MELKRQKILLGGISRIPTDRMTKDGECAESLNVVGDNGEIVPSLFPLTVEDEGLPDSWTSDCFLIFVHKGSTYTNYILQQGQDIGIWVREYDGDTLVAQGLSAFLTLGDGEELKDITAIGNTLVIATSESMYYVLYKDNEYKLLGSQLPKPAIVFYGDELSHYHNPQYSSSDSKIVDSSEDSDANKYGFTANKSPQYIFCSEKLCQIGTWEDDLTKEEIIQKIWSAYEDAVAGFADYNENYGEGQLLYQPYFFRYALKLYDGTYAMQSAPILVGGGAEHPCVLGTYYHDFTAAQDDDYRTFRAGAWIMIYNIRAKLMEQISSDWSDIVTSIDIFCSEPINTIDPGDGSIIEKGVTVNNLRQYYRIPSGVYEGLAYTNSVDVNVYGISDSQAEEKLLNYNVFYLVGSFLIDNSGHTFDEDYDPAQVFTANQEDLLAGIQLKRPDTDTLVTHTNTTEDSWDDYECDHYLIGQNLETLNNRLAIWDVTKVLGSGLPVLNSQSEVTATEDDGTITPSDSYPVYEYRFRYVLSIDGQTKTVDGKSWLGTNLFDPYCIQDDPGFLKTYGWIAYPDVNCKKVMIQRRQILSYSEEDGYTYAENDDWGAKDVMMLPMKEHPFLNCAYAWLGWGVELDAEVGYGDLWFDSDHFQIADDNTVPVDNYVYQSGVDNPFTFPTEGRYSFNYGVIGIGAVTLPLSTGQVGDFDFYVFTKGGIYSMKMNTDGTFATSTAFSRDVPLSRQTISEIDRGVVFVTVKGVKVIEGGQITDISPLMLGEHQTMPESIVTDVLQKVTSFTNGKVNPSAMQEGYYDTRPFMDFMSEAHAVYDYVGQRIVFFNEEYAYQYVYRITTASWHKVVLYNVYASLSDLVAELESDDDTEVSGDLVAHDGFLELEDGVMVATFYGVKYVHIKAGVNSFPQCYVSAYMSAASGEDVAPVYAVLDLATALDFTRTDEYNNGNTMGLIYTRTIDFDNPDVFKSIRDLRIRGNFDRSNVRYIMLVSNDGKRWAMKKSLRGASFKFMRLILLTKLAATERISYIEIDYEERFTNRLR